MRRIAFLSLVLLPLPALAHEPLWGETPQTFAFGVVHPEFRFAHGETRFSLQYAPETTRNLRLEVPFVANGQVGDSVLSIKSRLHARFGPDFKQMDALILGVQTGHLGGQVGYAFAHERLTDTIWASAMHTRTKTGGMTEFDAAYGYWVKRASTPVDTGVVLALGGHHEAMPGERLTGVHSSLIVTKGQTQARFGMLFPTQGRAQVRFGIEALL